MEIKRNLYLQKLIDRKHNTAIKVITGIRRCGKSYLLNTLFYNHLLESGVAPDHIIKFAFDSQADLSLIGEDLITLAQTKRKADPRKFSDYINSKITEDGMYYLLLDEVQELEAFEYVLNGFLYNRNLDVYVTGSNSKFLSTDIITEFRGRGDEVRIYPLSFSEFCSAYNGDTLSAWRDYCVYGGLPRILSWTNAQQKSEYLTNLFKETYIKDLINRNNIRNESEFDALIDVLASAIGSLTNPQKIANTFMSTSNKSLSASIIKRYIDCLCDAFVVSNAKQYNIKGRKYINTPSKYYFTDIGLRNARLNFRQTELPHIMENIIYNELVIRGYNVDVGIVEFNARDKDGKHILKRSEVDFVCNQGYKRYYIQSAFSIPDNEKLQQEQASLDRIDDSFKKIIIVQDFMSPTYQNDKGYTIINVLDFLLNPSSLDL